MFCERFGLREEGVEGGTVEEPAAEEDGADFLRVVNVVERVGIEENEVREFTGFDGPLRLKIAQKCTRIPCRGLKGLHGGEAGLD